MLGRKVIYVRCISCSYNYEAKSIRLLDKKANCLYRKSFMQVRAFERYIPLTTENITPGRRQSKTLSTINERGSKVDSNSVFDDLGDKWQSKTLLFIINFDLRSSIVCAFSIASYPMWICGLKCFVDYYMFTFLFVWCVAYGPVNSYGHVGTVTPHVLNKPFTSTSCTYFRL